MIANPLMARWDVVAATQHALRYGGQSLRNVPGLLKLVIREDMWHEYLTPRGETMHFTSFHDFITSPWGLDTTLSMLQRICAEDLDVLDLVDQVTTKPRGNATGVNQYTQNPQPLTPEPQAQLSLEEHKDEGGNHYNVMISSEQETYQGNGRAYALRRLRDPHKGRPDIHARVLAGELSPHQGMLEAGFRHQPTPIDSLYKSWRKVASEDRLCFLLEMLTPNERRVLIDEFLKEAPDVHA
jgi:hypothetical protein